VRVAVVDIGSNSTRLLIADVQDGRIVERDRRSVITRLGEGVDAGGRLGEAPRERVLSTIADFAAAIEAERCDRRVAVMTSAVRDAANGGEFAATVRERFGLDTRVLSGDDEARLTYLGATAARDPADGTTRLVIDIGGGSTELVIGASGEVDFHVSTQSGVVRQSERHLASDPPRPEELEALADDVRGILQAAVPDGHAATPSAGVAVAGTATSCAAIDLELEPYDPSQVEGHELTLAKLGELLSSLSALPLVERRQVRGLHPDRAPTIVAGIVILSSVLRAFELDAVEVSEHDILWGAALDAARG
jgi:exopolyphosphatase / guanosine-5'-triphosphate,3'-diphosphate pyrophosphatase